jgi:DNA-directed RNA polymerase specialized sigma24 family protein
MPSANFEQWFADASARWPKVKWDRAEYAKHLADDEPPYPIDLFLSGAAGCRIDSAWVAIHEDFGPRARAVLQRQPTADLSPDELWSETVGKLIAADEDAAHLPDGRRPARIMRFRGLVPLLNYFILIAKRLGIQRNRQKRPIMSLANDDEGQSPRDLVDDSRTPAEQAESAEQGEKLGVAVAKAFANLSADQQFLITMVYRNGMKQKEAGAILGWSEFKTCRSLSAAMQSLRDVVSEAAGDDWNSGLAGAWEQAWQKCWNNVQVPKSGASDPKAKKQLRV